jgi:hypothetical protein
MPQPLPVLRPDGDVPVHDLLQARGPAPQMKSLGNSTVNVEIAIMTRPGISCPPGEAGRSSTASPQS